MSSHQAIAMVDHHEACEMTIVGLLAIAELPSASHDLYLQLLLFGKALRSEHGA